MTAHLARVAVNGYGVIGKRVVDAVRAMPDMVLVGVADVFGDWRIRTAVSPGIAVFAATGQADVAMRAPGVRVAGNLEDLLAVGDGVVDTTPREVAASNVPTYRAVGVKAVFQGGETPATTGHSFPPVPGRTRRAPRPGRGDGGGEGRAHPKPQPLLDLAADTSGQPGGGVTGCASDRVHQDGRRADALNTTVELMRDLGRPRGDMWEVAVWEDVLAVQDDEAFLTYQVYREAIMVPETIDAIRALTDSVPHGPTSIAMTDQAPAMRREFLPEPEQRSPEADQQDGAATGRPGQL